MIVEPSAFVWRMTGHARCMEPEKAFDKVWHKVKHIAGRLGARPALKKAEGSTFSRSAVVQRVLVQSSQWQQKMRGIPH